MENQKDPEDTNYASLPGTQVNRSLAQSDDIGEKVTFKRSGKYNRGVIINHFTKQGEEYYLLAGREILPDKTTSDFFIMPKRFCKISPYD